MIKNIKDLLKGGGKVSIVLTHDANRDTLRCGIFFAGTTKGASEKVKDLSPRFLNGAVEDIEQELDSARFAAQMAELSSRINAIDLRPEKEEQPEKQARTAAPKKKAEKPAPEKKEEDVDLRLIDKSIDDLRKIVAAKNQPEASKKADALIDLAKALKEKGKLDDGRKEAVKALVKEARELPAAQSTLDLDNE